MDFMPSEPAPQLPSARRLGRTVLATIAVGGVILGAAAVLARPTSRTSPGPVTAVHSQATGQTPMFRPANAGADTGPGFVESDVAILPETRR